MKNTFLFFLYLFLPLLCKAQIGFSKIYDFDTPGCTYYNISYNEMENLLNIFGVVYNGSIPNSQGFIFVQCDTNGNITNYTTHFDSLGDDYVSQTGASIIKLNDNSGYAFLGETFTRSNGVILFTDNLGNKTNRYEYPDENSIADFYNCIIEDQTGFIVCGTKYRADYHADVFIMKIDRHGNKIWEKSFGAQNRNWTFNNLYCEHNLNYVLGITSASLSSVPLNQLNTQTIVLRLDTLGEEVFRWESPMALEESGALAIQKTDEGNWIYLSSQLSVHAQENYWTRQPKIILRDSNFNMIWEKAVGFSSSFENYLVNLLKSSEIGWTAIGSMADVNNNNTLSGFIYKFSNSGDSIWSRLDTVIFHSNAYTYHYLSGGIVLPSGSIIACGSVDDFWAPQKSWAWLMKISKDGCIDTLNCITTSLENINIIKNNINVYPNPVKTSLFFNNAGNSWDRIEIFDASGVLLSTLQKVNIGRVEMDKFQKGIYFLKFYSENGFIVKRIFKV